MNQFTYLGSNISFTENNVSIHLARVENSIDRWSIISVNPIKQNRISSRAVVSIILHRWTAWTLTKCIEKKLDRNYSRTNAACCLEQIFETTLHKTAAAWPLDSHLSNSSSLSSMLEKQERTDQRRSHLDSYGWICLCWPISKDLLLSALYRPKMQSWRPARIDECYG